MSTQINALSGKSYLHSHSQRVAPSRNVIQPWRRTRPCSRVPQAAFNLFDLVKTPAKSQKGAVDDLLALTEGTALGASTSPAVKSKILDIVENLQAAQAGTKTTDSRISATWKMAWTTEKETIFIVKNAGLFGTKAGGIYQVIDVEAGRLNNVITFPPEGYFRVDSTLSREGDQRLNFKFKAAKLKLPKRSIALPPFGQGWFDTVYIDNRVRVAKDIRGDTLVVTRDGPPRFYD